MSLNHLATRFSCDWPWKTLVLLCDGRVVCGCADPYAKRLLGDTRTDSLSGIWQNTTIEHEVWDTSNLGNAIPGATPRARIEIPSAAALNPLAAPAGTQLKIDTRVSNLSSRPFPAQATHGRRFVRLGAHRVALTAPSPRATMRGRGCLRRSSPPRQTWTLRRQVRPCIRRYRLVRKVRVGDDDQTVGCLVARA